MSDVGRTGQAKAAVKAFYKLQKELTNSDTCHTNQGEVK
jgi:hypothetical protein